MGLQSPVWFHVHQFFLSHLRKKDVATLIVLLFSVCIIICFHFQCFYRHVLAKKKEATSLFLPFPELPLHSSSFIFPDTCCRKNTRWDASVESSLFCKAKRTGIPWWFPCQCAEVIGGYSLYTSFYLAKIAFIFSLLHKHLHTKYWHNSNCGWDEKKPS